MQTEAQRRATSVYQQTPGYKALVKERRKTRQYKDMQNRHQRKDYANNKEWYWNHNLKRFGLTLNDYNAMLVEQHESCCICGTHQSKLKRRLAVDHCHFSGKVRRLLCVKCNTALGSVNDDTEILRKMIHYLESNK